MAVLDLTTKEAVRLFRGIADSSKPPSDAWLDSAIDALSARVEKALNRAIKQEAQVETFSLEEGQRLVYLRGWPVDTGQTFSLKYDALHAFAAASEIGTSLYHLDADIGIVEFEADFTAGSRVLRAAYTGGMATTTANLLTSYPDLCEAAAMQIAFWWESHARLGQASVSGPDGSVTILNPLDFLAPLEKAIGAHKRLLVF